MATTQQPDTRPVVFVGVPTYTGDARASAIGRIYSGTKGRYRLLQSPTGFSFFHFGSSLLARTFNELWCTALNYKLVKGERIDYFAMLHADVTPAAGWIDTLIDRLESHKLDVLAAVVPIKSDDGLTSTAYAKPGASPFKPAGRLTTAEVHRLPETFTADHLPNGHRLLNNTGCWVCKFDPAWVTKVHFEINDRIEWDETKKCWQPRCEPEDWHLSRQLNDLGVKTGATRAVSIWHHGSGTWGNEAPFGDPVDLAYRTTSVLDEPTTPNVTNP